MVPHVLAHVQASALPGGTHTAATAHDPGPSHSSAGSVTPLPQVGHGSSAGSSTSVAVGSKTASRATVAPARCDSVTMPSGSARTAASASTASRSRAVTSTRPDSPTPPLARLASRTALGSMVTSHPSSWMLPAAPSGSRAWARTCVPLTMRSAPPTFAAAPVRSPASRITSPPSAALAAIGPGPTLRSPPAVMVSLPPPPTCRPPPTSIAALTRTLPLPWIAHAMQPKPAPAPPAADSGDSISTVPHFSTHTSPGVHADALTHGSSPARQRSAPVALMMNAPASEPRPTLCPSASSVPLRTATAPAVAVSLTTPPGRSASMPPPLTLSAAVPTVESMVRARTASRSTVPPAPSFPRARAEPFTSISPARTRMLPPPGRRDGSPAQTGRVRRSASVFEAWSAPMTAAWARAARSISPPRVAPSTVMIPCDSSVTGSAMVIEPPHPPRAVEASSRASAVSVTDSSTFITMRPPSPAGTPAMPAAETLIVPATVRECAATVMLPPLGPDTSPLTAWPRARIWAGPAISSTPPTSRPSVAVRRHRSGAQSASDTHALWGSDVHRALNSVAMLPRMRTLLRVKRSTVPSDTTKLPVITQVSSVGSRSSHVKSPDSTAAADEASRRTTIDNATVPRGSFPIARRLHPGTLTREAISPAA